ncbi:Mbov_0398 family ICE element protein [Mycoplasmopsis adleri]|uniref:Mbov_0398 family ICE element protein n=1 Tax=Mycoplasmopsis adleri TaxID=51362 RepID=UPI00387355EF
MKKKNKISDKTIETLLPSKERLQELEKEKEVNDFIDGINLSGDNQIDNIMNSLNTEEAKEKEMTKKEKLRDKTQSAYDAQFSGRFTEAEDVGMFYRWKKEIEKNGKTVYKEINNIIRSYLLANEKKEIMREWKHDLFQALRKVSWSALSPYQLQINRRFRSMDIGSALSPYQLQINRRFRSMDIELSIINLKLNMIINALFKSNDELEKEIDNPSSEILTESKFFEKTIRGAVNKLSQDWTKKIAKKIQNGERAWNDFLASLSENEFDDILEEIGATNSTAQEQIEEK